MNQDAYVDITSHDTFTSGFPSATFKRLRDEDPCAWVEESDGGKGFWAITRYEDIKELNRQPHIFSSAKGIRLEEQTEAEYMARRTFQETDPPEHTRQVVCQDLQQESRQQGQKFVRPLDPVHFVQVTKDRRTPEI